MIIWTLVKSEHFNRPLFCEPFDDEMGYSVLEINKLLQDWTMAEGLEWGIKDITEIVEILKKQIKEV